MVDLNDAGLIDLMMKYPQGCTKEEANRVQVVARSFTKLHLSQSGVYDGQDWPKQFWRQNFNLVACIPGVFPIVGANPIKDDQIDQLHQTVEENAGRAREYLRTQSLRLNYDLYDPVKDEILSGLFARSVRLFCLMAEDSKLWRRDIGGIVLRCLADTTITFAYLAKCGTAQEFVQFKKYGEGQEKLLMLHLQDTYPEYKTLEGRDASAIAQELGGFNAELISIELGHWSKKDTRKMALACGMERLYRLVYSPGSGDLHGTWVSLKQSNLNRCIEPLHRLHRLPSFVQPPAFLDVIAAAQELWESAVKIGVDSLGYPALDPPLDIVAGIGRRTFEGESDTR
ncbi:MAG: hypothetical protein HY650_16625 [Acidobacteria bacterium]|nr:hypothetical protein [Acidobacteriota bacterium]